ncbi:MAG: TetR/AcrR family transcriptional regulator, regulator of cefoperazone and chloramphenicol [Actinomycetota bacterium]|nr:TetR/AcrR family transcriptional regulator, regulator of cefoperazone and chloramphenicol [Actinomycetota bacterium]
MFSILNMRLVEPDDATTRARIRDAAILLFGRDGFRETTVRAIAQEVGVSAALVIHHFGTKDGLRLACDEFIMGEVTAQAAGIGNGGQGTTAAIQSWLGEMDKRRPWLAYISRLLTDGSSTSSTKDDNNSSSSSDTSVGDRLFDDFVSYTERMFADGVADGSVHESVDPHMRAVILTSYGLSVLIFERQIGRAIGEAGLTSAAAARMTIPALEIFTHGVYTNDAMLRAAKDAIATKGSTP